MPWKLAVEVNVMRSMPTRVFGGRWGRRMVGVGDKDGGGMVVFVFLVFRLRRGIRVEEGGGRGKLCLSFRLFKEVR